MLYSYSDECLFLVHAVLPVPAIGFTCTESSYHSVNTKCDNIMNPDQNILNSNDNFEWIAKGEAKGAWIHLSFNEEIMITKILYRHNSRNHMTNQYFKNVLFEFSDQTKVNVTFRYPNVVLSDSEREVHLRIDPPVLSSSLKIEGLSGYDLSMSDGKNRPQDWKNRYGISYVQIFGLQGRSKLALPLIYLLDIVI